jgi:hypothetical protein
MDAIIFATKCRWEESMKVGCKIEGCALDPLLFMMLTDYLFQNMFLNCYSQLILKIFFAEVWQPLTYLRVLFMARIVRVISVQ